ncbi:hypothetical protein HanXRQr2_Chr11g0516881 [Helianthus annuus]|uniref:Uncharacterized protein n=1 Tax=Helianthus annuus TaxID=4232 RepID=A0A9K3HTX5_HELAN|nr:hypothetical protein HanXRQr2_Chr11g0516881 [Helianthus annuus]
MKRVLNPQLFAVWLATYASSTLQELLHDFPQLLVLADHNQPTNQKKKKKLNYKAFNHISSNMNKN